MKTKSLLILLLLINTCDSALADGVYCPQNAGYINIGMSAEQVLAACGEPLSRQQPNTTVTQQVPVTQLMFTNLNTGNWTYPGLNLQFSMWGLSNGQTGTNLEVDLINNKVSAVNINGTNTNAVSLCGPSIKIGAPASSVYAACGTPAQVNNTFINQSIPSNSKPEVWIYQLNQYQTPISLTFVDGKLQSIQ